LPRTYLELWNGFAECCWEYLSGRGNIDFARLCAAFVMGTEDYISKAKAEVLRLFENQQKVKEEINLARLSVKLDG
jgi:hypothetical protein